MKNIDMYPDVLNVEDIQEILGIGRRQAYELVSSGQFHTVRVGKRIKILKSVLLSWLYGKEGTVDNYEIISNSSNEVD